MEYRGYSVDSTKFIVELCQFNVVVDASTCALELIESNVSTKPPVIAHHFIHTLFSMQFTHSIMCVF